MTRLNPEPRGLHDGFVALRFWSPEDLNALVAELQDGEISRWVHPIPWPYGQGEGADFIRFAQEERTRETGAHLAVLSSQTSMLVGSVALTRIDWDNRSAHLGYWTAKSARNTGVARRASALMIAWAFQELGIERIELLCDPDNLPSQHVAHALGFKQEGLLRSHLKLPEGRRDSLLFSRLASDRS